jgi:hypothetical protein
MNRHMIEKYSSRQMPGRVLIKSRIFLETLG